MADPWKVGEAVDEPCGHTPVPEPYPEAVCVECWYARARALKAEVARLGAACAAKDEALRTCRDYFGDAPAGRQPRDEIEAYAAEVQRALFAYAGRGWVSREVAMEAAEALQTCHRELVRQYERAIGRGADPMNADRILERQVEAALSRLKEATGDD